MKNRNTIDAKNNHNMSGKIHYRLLTNVSTSTEGLIYLCKKVPFIFENASHCFKIHLKGCWTSF